MADRLQSKNKTPGNKSVERALEILEYSAKYSFPMSAPEISRRLKFNKATTYHLLDTLEYRGYVFKDSKKRYQLTEKLHELSGYAIQQRDALCIETLNKNSKILLDKYPQCDLFLGTIVNSLKGMYLYTASRGESFLSPGALFPLHATASGKVLLAYADSKLSKAYFNQFQAIKYTHSTTVDKGDLLKQLYKIKSEGFYLNEGEYFSDLFYVAAPVFNCNGALCSAVCMGGHKDQIWGHVQDVINELTALASRMSSAYKNRGLE